MRRLTSFSDEDQAQLFCDALYAEGIETTLRSSGDSAHDVWVHDERRMEDARIALQRFEEQSSRAKFEELARHGRIQRTSDIEELRSVQRKTESLRAAMSREAALPQIGRGTLAIIIICVGFAVLTKLQGGTNISSLFTFSDERFLATSGWKAIASGQVWRLITPAFLHFGIFHILLNLWWIKDLGTAIEHVDRTRNFLALVFTTIVVSHLVQVVFSGFAPFGGMSGVAYGLFGYVWIRGKFDPQWRLQMPRGVVVMMLAWLGLGFFMGQLSAGTLLIANGVHVGGLLTGVVWGFFASGYLRRRFKR